MLDLLDDVLALGTGNFLILYIETIIYHNFPNEEVAGDCEPRRCAKHKIIYDVTMPQIIALIEQSTECRQFIKVRRLYT